jgi:hypothetical protein
MVPIFGSIPEPAKDVQQKEEIALKNGRNRKGITERCICHNDLLSEKLWERICIDRSNGP